jgi:hypothetical protein
MVFYAQFFLNIDQGVIIMGNYVVTTFGKWEEQRKKLVADLLNNPEVAKIVTKEKIEKALFDDVNSVMFETGRDFVIKNMPKVPQEMSMKDLIIQSYKLSLTVVLDSLAKALSIDKALLEASVNTFNKACTDAIDSIIDISMQIGGVSEKAKATAIIKLYGENFAKRFPDLVTPLKLNDAELSAFAAKEIDKQIIPENYGDRAENVKQQLIYIKEMVLRLAPTPDFAQLFKERTGRTMQEYKDDVAKNQNRLSVVQSCPAQTVAAPEVELAGMKHSS